MSSKASFSRSVTQQCYTEGVKLRSQTRMDVRGGVYRFRVRLPFDISPLQRQAFLSTRHGRFNFALNKAAAALV